MAKTRCLSETTLRLFNDGQLSASDIGLIGSHLELCDRCLLKLESLEPGPLERGLQLASAEAVLPEGNDHSRIDSNAQKVLQNVFPEGTDAFFRHRGCDLYCLHEEAGEASIGKLYFATDLVMDRAVKIIIPNQKLISSVDHRAQLIHDGNNASWLNHENILRVTHFGAWDETQCYVAMPEINSCSLARIIDIQTEFDLLGVLLVFGQICSALQHAHLHNVVHRHLNPTNIFVDEQLHVLVSQFGLTFDGRYQFGLIEPLVSPTRYNSPESIRNEPKRIDHRTDIFSAGAILDSLVDLSTNLSSENEQALRDIARKSQRHSRGKRFQTVDQVINEVGERICANA